MTSGTRRAGALMAAAARAETRGDFPGALRRLEEAVALRRGTAPSRRLADALHALGSVLEVTGDIPAARAHHEEALALRQGRRRPSKAEIAASFHALGRIAWMAGNLVEAQNLFERALALREAVYGPEHRLVAALHNNLGIIARDRGDLDAARRHHGRSLAIRIALGQEGTPAIAAAFLNLGVVEVDLGHFVEARENYGKALSILRSAGPARERDLAGVLHNIGNLSRELGDLESAMRHHEEALAIRRALFGDSHLDVAMSLNSLGNARSDAGDLDGARRVHREALAIRRSVYGATHYLVGETLINLGLANLVAGDLPVALDQIEQSYELYRNHLGDDHPFLCTPLLGLAAVLVSLKRFDEASRMLADALRLALTPAGVSYLTFVYSWLAKLARGRGDIAVAIFHGKQAVNASQRERAQLTGLAPELQRSFLTTKEDIYRDLADVMVEAGRLSEAQQILAMLKEEELFTLLRGEAMPDGRLTFAALTALEADWQRHGDEMGENLVRLTQDVAALRAVAERTPEQDGELKALRAELDGVGRSFRMWLDGLRGDLTGSANPDAQGAAVNLDLLERMQGELRSLGEGVAMLSYILTQEKLSIILTTARLQVSRDTQVAERAVNRLVHEFRLALDARLEDEALELGQTLWRHLIAPVEALLDELGVTTLMVVPYGTLRYVPLAALHDGARYLVERFAVSVLTLAAQGGLREKPRPDWSVAGFGLAREVAGYRRLLAVEDELAGIVRAPGAESGVYPGIVRIDDAFTEDALADALEAHRAVHVASHFVLNPARGFQSHLLLGTGEALTLDRLRDPSFDFHGVDLLTLSACETAMGGGRENGREFEGFGALVQQRGAKAVIASLWPVSDASTAPLMTAFYAARHGGASKAAALREAQLSMLAGPHAHPFHWAPFVLMGNWL